MAHSFDNLIRNFTKHWMNFRFYALRAIYYGLIPGMFFYGKEGLTSGLFVPVNPMIQYFFAMITGQEMQQAGYG